MDIDADANQAATRRNVLLTFQGGGAKGIVHVGALKAIEAYEFGLKGVAGTSAGAMIAALVAAGYTADELLNPVDRSHILDRFEGKGFKKATDFFGGWGWWCIEQMRDAVDLGWLLVWRIVAAIVSLALLNRYHPVVATGVAMLLLLLVMGVVVFAITGLTSVKNVRDFIDLALRAKLGDPDGGKSAPLTFRDLYERSEIPLKIVATNITDEVGEVFSYTRTPDVAVADAVAASICLPVIFRPWKFDCIRGTGVSADRKSRRFQDGGLISNLPVWTLDDERRADGDCLTIAFAIRPEPSSASADGARRNQKHWLSAIASAVVSGSSELDTRAVDDIIYVPIECTLDTLQFDAGLDTLAEIVSDASEAVRNRIKEDWITFPNILDAASQDVWETFESALSAEVGNWFRIASVPRAKVAMAMYERGNHTEFQVSYAHGFDNLPEVSYEELRSVWESNTVSLARVRETAEWAVEGWRAVVPVSHRTYRTALPEVDGHPERPLLFIIEFDASAMAHAAVANGSFHRGIAFMLKDVVIYAKTSRLYDAVQRISSSPWH